MQRRAAVVLLVACVGRNLSEELSPALLLCRVRIVIKVVEFPERCHRSIVLSMFSRCLYRCPRRAAIVRTSSQRPSRKAASACRRRISVRASSRGVSGSSGQRGNSLSASAAAESLGRLPPRHGRDAQAGILCPACRPAAVRPLRAADSSLRTTLHGSSTRPDCSALEYPRSHNVRSSRRPKATLRNRCR